MQQLISIVFVLLLLWGAVWLLRKKGLAAVHQTLKNRKSSPAIQQIDRLRLTPQHSLHLIEVENRKLLIAVHAQGVTVLKSDSVQLSFSEKRKSAEIR